jgi:hypothetical protein
MLRNIVLVVSLLIDPAMAFGGDTSTCTQLSDLSTARVRWEAVRNSRIDPAHNEENCRSYSTNFFEAVKARQAASFCRDGIDRERALELLDTEIDAFNDLIATRCSS